jgi:hypothetical protein
MPPSVPIQQRHPLPAPTYPNIRIFTSDLVVYSQRPSLNAGVRYNTGMTGQAKTKSRLSQSTRTTQS